VIEKTDYSQVVHPDDVEQYIRIVPNQLDHQISAQMKTFHTSLEELGIAVSTGRVVDFRVKHLLLAKPDKRETIPLIYPNNLHNGSVHWPLIPSKNRLHWLAHLMLKM
jgi:adenine-specific DNA-methyltransferase